MLAFTSQFVNSTDSETSIERISFVHDAYRSLLVREETKKRKDTGRRIALMNEGPFLAEERDNA